jgi:hypothetical protein
MKVLALSINNFLAIEAAIDIYLADKGLILLQGASLNQLERRRQVEPHGGAVLGAVG